MKNRNLIVTNTGTELLWFAKYGDNYGVDLEQRRAPNSDDVVGHLQDFVGSSTPKEALEKKLRVLTQESKQTARQLIEHVLYATTVLSELKLETNNPSSEPLKPYHLWGQEKKDRLSAENHDKETICEERWFCSMHTYGFVVLNIFHPVAVPRDEKGRLLQCDYLGGYTKQEALLKEYQKCLKRIDALETHAHTETLLIQSVLTELRAL